MFFPKSRRRRNPNGQYLTAKRKLSQYFLGKARKHDVLCRALAKSQGEGAWRPYALNPGFSMAQSVWVCIAVLLPPSEDVHHERGLVSNPNFLRFSKFYESITLGIIQTL